MEKLITFSLDCDKGVLIINGREYTNVTAFSLIYKNGEYGLSVTHSDLLCSNVESTKFLVELLPDEIFGERISDKGKKP